MKYFLLGAILVGAFIFGRTTAPKPTVTETVRIEVDTIRIDSIIRDTVYQTTVEEHWLTRVETDTVTKTDSILVFVPISTHVFKDSLYRAEISGYNVDLLSMEVYPRTVYKTEVNTITERTKWGVGITAGYGISDNGLSPFLGIGINYNLFSW